MPNTVQVQVQCARPRLRIYVQSVYRSTMYTYTYSIHTQAHGLTYNMRIALATHAKHCTRTRTVRTPKHTGLRTIASLRLPTSKLYKHNYSAHAYAHAPTCNGCTVQAIHVDPCASTSTACAPTSTHPGTIGASLRPVFLLTLLIGIALSAFVEGDSWSLEVIFLLLLEGIF